LEVRVGADVIDVLLGRQIAAQLVIPAVEAGHETRDELLQPVGLVELVDVFPTFIDLCSIEAPHKLQGKSFASLLDDPQGAGKEVAYTVVTRGKLLGRSIRTERWRYAEWGNSDQAELYDLKSDPHEDHNLVEDDRHRQQRQTMHKLLVKTQAAARSESAR
ncbi:MAG: DUF4976 domain-containing protein, partial [Planctomycetes bacterium]|nr:DUF4976 domain-containing protein [Planctomycetota bacterium]